MNELLLTSTAAQLLAGCKGLLAMDESNATCNKRFGQLGIPQTAMARRDWRELIVSTPRLGEYISGAILCDETIQQTKRDGTPITKAVVDAGIIPGIKVDTGAVAMAGFIGEKITEGLDGMRERLVAYKALGARFAKWRGVITIGEGTPTNACMEANAHALARYAALCQEAGLVPMVEPEVLMDGNHDLHRCLDVTQAILHHVFDQLHQQHILLEGMILKPNMVMPGLACSNEATIEAVADATIQCLYRSVPAAVGGIAFLSGGQTGGSATQHLNAMHVRYRSRLPWPLTFSFARAIQQPAMEIWDGKDENLEAAQQALYHRAKCDSAARRGAYDTAMENVGSA